MLLPEHYVTALHRLRGALGTSVIVAGGWLRDLLTGDEPKDIDVFVSARDLTDVLARLDERSIAYRELDFEEIDNTFDPNEVSSGEAVEAVYEVEFADMLPVQLIVVCNELTVLQWVRHFGARCSQIYTRLDKYPFVAREAYPYAFRDAQLKVWRANSQALESEATLKKRAAKFEARGYTIDWSQRAHQDYGLDPVDLMRGLFDGGYP